MGVSKEEVRIQAARAALRREVETIQRAAEGSAQGMGAVERLAAFSTGYDALWSHLGSEGFRSLSVRPNGGGGRTFNLKAVLEVQQTSYGVYMYGEVKNAADIPGLLDRLLVRADWRTDKYYKP